ncbi:Anaerobic nitric oxide reductase flavorubredoxin [compost metagenome]
MTGSFMSKEYECQLCHYTYSEADGEPLENIEPGTQWDDLSENFKCPHCRAKKKMFKEVVK